jgi:thymidylate kinase
VLILLDGANGAGKTSVADVLKNAYDFTVLRQLPPEDRHPLTESTAGLARYHPGTALHIVCDRWHMSERVYGKLDRGRCGLSPIEWAAVESFLIRLGAFGCLCQARVDTLVARLEARGEVAVPERLLAEHLSFEKAITWSRVPWVVANTEKASPERIAEALVAKAREEEERALEEAPS